MLTKEQWENLARFAGITVEPDGIDVNGLTWYWSTELGKHWNPEFDWRDFGPLWVKLERWRWTEWELELPIAVHTQINAFYDAQMRGTETDLMQSGCALGAAIGATMGDKA